MSKKFKIIEDFLHEYKTCPFCNSKLKLSFDTILSFDEYPEASKNFVNFYKNGNLLSFDLKLKMNTHNRIKIKIDCTTNKLQFEFKKSHYVKDLIFSNLPFLYLCCSKRKCYKYYACSSLLKESKCKIHQFKIDFESFSHNNYWVQNISNDPNTKIFSMKNSELPAILIPKQNFNNPQKLFKIINTAIVFG